MDLGVLETCHLGVDRGWLLFYIIAMMMMMLLLLRCLGYSLERACLLSARVNPWLHYNLLELHLHCTVLHSMGFDHQA
jgi:hypothetical protein